MNYLYPEAYITTPRESIGMIPFYLVYSGEAVVQMEIGDESIRRNIYRQDNDELRLLDLDMITKIKERATT